MPRRSSRTSRVQLGEALHVGLVDEGLVPGRARRAVALPVEARVDHEALRDRVRVVLVVELQVGVVAVGHVGEHVRGVAHDRALDGLRVGSISSLWGLKRWPRSGSHGPCTRNA